jgi:hypothetical protein
LDNAIAVREAVAQLIADVYSGKLQPRVAAGLAPLMNLQLRLIETTELERRVARLEKKMLADAENGVESKRDFSELPVHPSPREGLGSNGDVQGEANTSADWVEDSKP